MSNTETITTDIARALAMLLEKLNNSKDAATLISRTSLQAGIFDFARFVYKNGEMHLYTTNDDFSDADMHYEGLPQSITDEATVAEISEQLPPQLKKVLASYDNLPILDYVFIVHGEIIIGNRRHKIAPFIHVSEPKKQWLLTAIDKYLQEKISNGTYPTKKLETFFLARHLVSPQLFPQPDYHQIIRTFDLLLELNKNNKDAQKEHRYHITRALSDWAENHFLTRFYDITKIGFQAPVYQLKAEHPAAEPAALDLLLYVAGSIIRYEPNYSRPGGVTYVNLAKELGSSKAATLLRSGTGNFQPYTSAVVKLTPNDVFATIDIQVLQEDGSAYQEALAYLQNLLNSGFPRSYSIVLKSKEKQFLPIKGLAKNGTHRFFANALQYVEVYPALEAYARIAMSVEYQWYEDAEAQQCCMPGSYAVFGLGFADTGYSNLVKDYMARVDTEHQSVQNQFTLAYIDKHGAATEQMPVITTCLLACQEMKPVKQLSAISHDALSALILSLQNEPSYSVEHVIFQIWGGKEKLAALAKKKGAAPQLQTLLQLAAN
ncbi:DUF6138 family protein [Chitinophaga sp. Hz27]|uniref:DUF6138 family protein n=1 Tax=Chitinophaga sp. Hz27 TaxID=3347169 RepID=UPI0035D54EAC